MVDTYSYAGGIQAARYGFDKALPLKILVAKLLFSNANADVETSVRNDNSSLVVHVRTIKSLGNGRILNSFPETKREELN